MGWPGVALKVVAEPDRVLTSIILLGSNRISAEITASAWVLLTGSAGLWSGKEFQGLSSRWVSCHEVPIMVISGASPYIPLDAAGVP